MKRAFITSLFLSIALVCAGVWTNSHAQSAAAIKAKGMDPSAAAVHISLPRKEGSVRFAVIGDTGSGSRGQYEVGEMLTRARNEFPFEFVLMLGDNMYGGETPADFIRKFSGVYKTLLDDKVKFYATLGNHDLPLQANYDNFNMNGKEYYKFKKRNVSFYSLNSNLMDAKQIKWLETELADDDSEWKIAFFHHPLYSSAR